MDANGGKVGGRIDPGDEKKVFFASMVTNPISVFHAILPEGFQIRHHQT